MNNQTNPQTKLASIDLDQWRKDIDVFAAATTSALDAIVNDLSNACSSDGVHSVAPRRQHTTITKPDPVAKPVHGEPSVKRVIASPGSVNKSKSPSNGGSRLASIKEKLASRMTKG